MIAKVIAHGNTRGEAILRMRRALESFVVEGIKTNVKLQQRILTDEDFVRGRLSTALHGPVPRCLRRSPGSSRLRRRLALQTVSPRRLLDNNFHGP